MGITAFELGDLYEVSNRLGEAEEWLRRSLEVRRKHAADDPVALVETGWRLALIIYEAGQPIEAEELLLPLLELLEKLPSMTTEHKEQKRLLLQTLGKIYTHVERFEDALGMHQRAMKLMEEDGLLEDVGYFDALCYLGETYFVMERFEESERSYLKGLELAEVLFGPEDPEYLEVLESLQEVYETLWARLSPKR